MADGVYHKYDTDTRSYESEIADLQNAVRARVHRLSTVRSFKKYRNGGYENEVLKGIELSNGNRRVAVQFMLDTLMVCTCGNTAWLGSDDAKDETGFKCHRCCKEMAPNDERHRYVVRLGDYHLVMDGYEELLAVLTKHAVALLTE